MAEAARPDTPATSLDPAGRAGRAADKVPSEAREKTRERAVCCYTLLVSRGTAEGTSLRSHHETRILGRVDGEWKVVHVHKSPAWKAPYQSELGVARL